MEIVEVLSIVCCCACALELVAGLLQPRLFPFGKLSKLKSAAQQYIYIKEAETIEGLGKIKGESTSKAISPRKNLKIII